MKTRVLYLSCLLPLVALVPEANGQATIVVTASPLEFNPNDSSHEISLSLTVTGDNDDPAYNLVGVSFDLQIYGVGSPTTATVPTIYNVAGNTSNFPGSQVASTGDLWSRYISIDWNQKAISVPVTTPIEFAVVTVDAGPFSSGSWTFKVLNIEFDDQVGSSLTSVGADNFTGTFSAVPEPEETMAVMAGLSLGLGWWLRRLRGRPGSAVSRNP